ncbi:hypothetical protein BH23ACT3_BH23ACT3_04870 [soil metagenome]
MDARIRDARIRDIVSVLVSLAPGEVTTYGDVAEVAGHPGRARLVGRILAKGGCGDVPELPWWRVVNAAGRLVPGHEREQAELLWDERVEVRDGRVVRAPIGRFDRVQDSPGSG